MSSKSSPIMLLQKPSKTLLTLFCEFILFSNMFRELPSINDFQGDWVSVLSVSLLFYKKVVDRVKFLSYFSNKRKAVRRLLF